MYTERQTDIVTAITQGLGLPADTASQIRVVQSPGYIDSVIETLALMGAIGQAVATVGEPRGLGSQRVISRTSGKTILMAIVPNTCSIR
jgi:hypothetical protein